MRVFHHGKRASTIIAIKKRHSIPLPQTVGIFSQMKSVFADHPLIDITTENGTSRVPAIGMLMGKLGSRPEPRDKGDTSLHFRRKRTKVPTVPPAVTCGLRAGENRWS